MNTWFETLTVGIASGRGRLVETAAKQLKENDKPPTVQEAMDLLSLVASLLRSHRAAKDFVADLDNKADDLTIEAEQILHSLFEDGHFPPGDVRDAGAKLVEAEQLKVLRDSLEADLADAMEPRDG